MSFLDGKPNVFNNLGGMIEKQFLGNNRLETLDLIQKDGSPQRFGKLGDFSKKIDQSEKRSYTEAGFYSLNQFNFKQRDLEILMQQPSASVVIKKRAFSSLAENYRPDASSQEELLTIRATKNLFQNKINQIANFEKLVKINKVSVTMGYIHEALIPTIIDAANNMFAINGSANNDLSSFIGILNKLKQVQAYNKENILSKWFVPNNQLYDTKLGQGTGVFELTNFTTLSTNLGLGFNSGSFSVNFSDPYNLMFITPYDIEKALSDTFTPTRTSPLLQIGQEQLNLIKDQKISELNSIRASRGASPINYYINPNSFIGKPVKAVVNAFEINFDFKFKLQISDIDPIFLESNDKHNDLTNFGINPKEAFTQTEALKFISIIETCATIVSSINSIDKNVKSYNKNLNTIRKELFLQYKGKYIINPMDTVHIYASSKSEIDSKISKGLQSNFNALSFLQFGNNTVDLIKNSFLPNNYLDVEKSIIVGPDFPSWLWPMLRSTFVNQTSGPQIFSGVVDSVSGSYSSSSGAYSVSIGGKDNTYYFGLGQVNMKPSIDVFNGSFYDPLTPFDIKYDTVLGITNDKPKLLPENQALLDNSDFVSYKMGPEAGAIPSSLNFNRDYTKESNLNMIRTFYDPDGFVYKFKKGIGTLVQFNNSTELLEASPSAVSTTKDPFAGQSVIDVLSLLITGEPHNFINYYKTVINFDTYKRDATTGEDPSVSYYRALENNLKKRNYLYGNFTPFKKLSINEADVSRMISNQTSALNFNKRLQEKINERAEFSDKVLALEDIQNPVVGNSTIKSKLAQTISELKSKITDLDKEISDIEKNDYNSIISDPKNYLSVIGDDISVNTDNYINTNTSLEKNKQLRKELRKKVNFLTQRLSWKVKANEDINLVIIDDSFDKDYDLMAYEKSFQNQFSLFQSQFNTVSQFITDTAKLLNLEVFADSQGHIQIRSPQYNKVPSSVFSNLLKQKQDKGIQVFPEFLEKLYAVQLDTLFKQIEFTEDLIRLYCALLGKAFDSDCEALLKSSVSGGAGFSFLSNENSGRILGGDSSFKIFTESNPDIKQDIKNKIIPVSNKTLFKTTNASISDVSTVVNTQASVNNLFDVVKRKNYLFGNNGNPGGKESLGVEVLQNGVNSARVQLLQDRISAYQGQKIDLTSLYATTNGQTLILATGRVAYKDLLGILDKIKQSVEERQRNIKIASKALVNLKEGLNLDNSNIATNILAPNLTNNSHIPENFEHMIEDETYDDFGPGSGQRFIIKPVQIKSIDLSENPPQFTTVEVSGSYGDGFIAQGDLPSDLNSFQNGGNAITSAQAIDYDLFKMYGFRSPNSIHAPFLTNPETQLAPYAVMLLNIARGSILQGKVSIAGSEYMQVGDVVYIEDRDLLFYVEQVSHSFGNEGSFSTTLSLSYGHNPGEYIPTPLDIVGKILYKNKNMANYYHHRQDNTTNQTHLGVILGNADNQSRNGYGADSIIDSTSNKYAESNISQLQAISSQGNNATSLIQDNYNPVVEIRIYYNSKAKDGSYKSSNATLLSQANTVKDLLTRKITLTSNDAFKDLKTIDASRISVVEVDLATDPIRYCSGKSFYLSRLNVADSDTINSSFINNPAQKVKNVDKFIYNNVIDCWVVFKKS